MTVYVVQEKTGVDITDALRFGEFENLLPRKDQLMISSQPVVHALKKKLKDFLMMITYCVLAIHLLLQLLQSLQQV